VFKSNIESKCGVAAEKRIDIYIYRSLEDIYHVYRHGREEPVNGEVGSG